jgi:antitoxin PrlF
MKAMLRSKLTQRSQTTVPPGVRKILGLAPGEQLGYIIEGNEVRLVNASAADREDPVLAAFLDFLARDMAVHPERLAAFPASLLERARAAADGVDLDHDAPIDGAIPL